MSDNKIHKISKFYCHGISQEKKKNSVLAQFSVRFPLPNPLQNANFINTVVSASLKYKGSYQRSPGLLSGDPLRDPLTDPKTSQNLSDLLPLFLLLLYASPRRVHKMIWSPDPQSSLNLVSNHQIWTHTPPPKTYSC